MSKILTKQLFDDDTFEHLANILNNKWVLINSVKTSKEVEEICAGLNQQGYNTQVKNKDFVYNIYVDKHDIIDEQNKVSKTAMVNIMPYANFSNVTGNQYRAFTAGVYDYDFDDGSIWKLEEFEDGPYLIKVVDDEDEDIVIREKTASKEIENIVDDENFDNMFKAFYQNVDNELIADIHMNTDVYKANKRMLNAKINTFIANKIKDNAIINVIKARIKSANIKTVDDIQEIIQNITKEA